MFCPPRSILLAYSAAVGPKLPRTVGVIGGVCHRIYRTGNYSEQELHSGHRRNYFIHKQIPVSNCKTITSVHSFSFSFSVCMVPVQC